MSGGFEYESLAKYRLCIARIEGAWNRFMSLRQDRLRHGHESEKVAEGIVEDLFTEVLDWAKGDLLYQQKYADIVLSQNLMKYLLIEVKRPESLRPHRQSLEKAVEQARRYAADQHVDKIAATDGRFFYAADIDTAGGMTPRVLLDLSLPMPPRGLWWLSVHGIYRICECPEMVVSIGDRPENSPTDDPPDRLLHPKYQLPANCFAYVKDANDPGTWKLPYLTAQGRVDGKRLPKAIQALISNYRGSKVAGIPESAIRQVILRLAQAAKTEGRLPAQPGSASQVYIELARVLDQLGLSEMVSG